MEKFEFSSTRPTIAEIDDAFRSGEINESEFHAALSFEASVRYDNVSFPWGVANNYLHRLTQQKLAGEIDATEFEQQSAPWIREIMNFEPEPTENPELRGCNPFAWVTGLFHRGNR